MSNNNLIDELSHHGIKGMKWGIRRYQYKDGSLTPAGRKKVAKMKDEYTQLTGKKLIRKPTSKNSKSSDQNGEKDVKKKSIKEMTDVELRDKINRLQMEKQAMSLQSETGTKGERFISTVGKQVVKPAAIDAGKRVLTDWLVKKGSEMIGLKTSDTKDALAELRKEVDTLELNKRKAVAEDYFNKRKEKENRNKSNESETVKAEFVKEKKKKKSDYSNRTDDSVITEAVWEEVGKNTVSRYENMLVPVVRDKRG